MNKKSLAATIILFAAVIIGIYSFLNYKKRSVAGLKIFSTPKASVFLDDKLLGDTPFEDSLSSGEYILKLIPEETATEAVSWQGKLVLNSKVLTYVNRELGESELVSAGEVVYMEKIGEDESQIAVYSKLDAASVLLDGQQKGQTPILLRDVTEGDHDVAISSSGFLGRTVRVQATPGYKVVVEFQLALDKDSDLAKDGKDGELSDGSEEKRQYVRIKDTPTGFLRVREKPSTATKELTKVSPGDEYLFLDEDKGWFKIEYEENKQGWVSGRYAEKVE